MKKFLAIFLLGCSCLLAGAFPDKPAVEGPVNDYAGMLSPSEIVELQHILVDFADSTSTQICLVTVPDLEGMSVSQYAIELGLRWKVGDDQFNNGVVFLVKPKTGSSYGEAFIAVGRGLEGAIPDITCHRIVNDIAIPYFKTGDYYGGIKAACFKIMELADEEYHSPYQEDEEDDAIIAFIVFCIIVFVVITIVSNAKKNGGNGGGGNGGSGGRNGSDRPFIFVSPGSSFGGGFGSSGGGSFGGGFSGGFGGGSFGGGGGGGRW